jgi:intracellular septation protein
MTDAPGPGEGNTNDSVAARNNGSGNNISSGTNLLIDFGPLVVFLVTYWLTKIETATIAFMIATAAAIIYARVKHKHVSKMLIFSGFMILIFGGLTLFFGDKRFIQMKPTIYYTVIAAILFFGVITKRPTLKAVIGTAYPELQDRGWHLLTRNFAWFFVAMAILNELVWRHSTFGFWLGYKLWGALPLTILFGAINVPMIMRHSDAASDAEA